MYMRVYVYMYMCTAYIYIYIYICTYIQIDTYAPSATLDSEGFLA